MAIDFGSIKTYNPDRGFGFVGGTFANSYRQVFFHIKTIKRQCSELAEKLESGENFREVNLWYQTETTEKGEQVSLVWLNVDDIPQILKQELSDLIEKLENIWKDLSSPKPIWLDLVTIELIGANRRNELSIARDNLQSQRRQAQEEQRRQAQEEQRRQAQEEQRRQAQEEQRRQAEEEQRKQAEEEQRKQAEEEQRKQAEALRNNEIVTLVRRHNLTQVEADELYRLLADMRPLNFTRSKQLSAYIVKHKLGYRYPNISGIVTMEEAGTEWDFHGGFSPQMYGIICKELNLGNERTSAIPTRFRGWEE